MEGHICLSEYTNRASKEAYKPRLSVSLINLLEYSQKIKSLIIKQLQKYLIISYPPLV